MNLHQFFDFEFDEHLQTFNMTRQALKENFANTVRICKTALQNGNKIMFFGNGGSAADAQHLATELTIKYKKERAPMAAIALTTDTSALTAAGNDYGYDYVFARQIEALGKKGDVAIGISTSGNSPNVNIALKKAREMGIVTIGFAGRNGGAMPDLCDEILCVPVPNPDAPAGRIQEMHILLGQMLCGALEIELGLIDAETVHQAYKKFA